MRRLYLLLATIAVALAVPTHSPKYKNNCIDHCKCKTNLIKSASSIQVIDCDGPLTLNETTFRNADKDKIRVISFNNVIINQIQESVFKGFNVLEDVLILNSHIGSIDDKAFNHVKKLKFEDCRFEDSPNLFSEKLEELHFGRCQIEEIPNLGDLLSLTFLNLSGNNIKDIDIETFAELFDLEELYLSNNEIFKIPPTLFINNRALNSLYLDNNPLKVFYLNTSEYLETLSLSNCHLETFDEKSTQKLSGLSDLNLSNNRIKTLTSKAMSHMKALSVINLSYNKLERLDDDIFAEQEGLVKITLDGNNFTSLPNFYSNSKEAFDTYTFSCNYCGLKTLSNTVFRNMPAIIDLQLSHNEFMNVDNMLQMIPSLKILDISYNNIALISAFAFKGNMNLETLNIAGNPLIRLNPEVFAHNAMIKTIDARNCSLEMLWSNKNAVIPSLKRLLLGNNKLRSLTVEDFKIMPRLVSVDLSNNSLEFSNDFCNVINWMDTKQIQPVEYTTYLGGGLKWPYIENPNSLDFVSFSTWREFYKNKCPEISTIPAETWKPSSDDNLFKDDDSSLLYEEEEDDDDDDYYDDETEADEEKLDKFNEEGNDIGRYSVDDNKEMEKYDDDFNKYNSLDDEHENERLGELQDKNDSLTKASYILSVTSAFILTALVVLTVAVTITLIILKRNNNFNMHKANLPRLKIPMWHSTPGQKKHSGSVYRPLSEDLSGPKTPKLSRYEFASTPTVHSSNP